MKATLVISTPGLLSSIMTTKGHGTYKYYDTLKGILHIVSIDYEYFQIAGVSLQEVIIIIIMHFTHHMGKLSVN